MALVKTIDRSKTLRRKLHPTTASCRAYVVQSVNGERLLQLETLGSRGRKVLGAASQTIQFHRDALRQLRSLIDEVLSSSASE